MAKKKKPRGSHLSKIKYETSEELDALIMREFVSRTEATKLLWNFLKKTGYETQSQKVRGKTVTYILPDDPDAIDFLGKKIKLTDIPKVLNQHLYKMD
jgi:chromatin remodeling complex protein RSC6